MSLIFNFVVSLSTYQIFFTLVSAVFAWYYLSTYRRRRLLSKIPGPAAWPLIGNLNLFWSSSESFTVTGYRLFNQLTNLYSSAGMFKIELGPKTVVVLTAPATVDVLIKDPLNTKKGWLFEISECIAGQGLNTSYGNKWRHDRKLLTPAFHFDILDDFNPIVNRHALVLVDMLKSRTRINDLYDTICACTLDVILETAMGINCNIQHNASNQYLLDQAGFKRLLAERAFNPLHHNDTMYKMSAKCKELDTIVKRVLDYNMNVISVRKEELINLAANANEPVARATKNRRCFMDIMLDIHLNESTKELMTLQNILDQTVTFVIAGNDTTGTTIPFAIYHIASDMKVQRLIHEELDQLYGTEDGDDLNVTTENIRRMPYLEAVIKETLRLTSPIPFLARLLVTDLEVNGYVIPKGTEVWCYIPGVQLRETLYVNADKFVPERWLSGNESMRSVSPCSFLPFGGGPRNCIGQRFAMNEVKIILAHIFKKFTVELVDREELRLEFGLVLKPTKPMRVDFNSRY